MKVVAPGQDETNCTVLRVGNRRAVRLLACSLSERVTDPVECYFGPGRIRGGP
jgi:hypothetical protein